MENSDKQRLAYLNLEFGRKNERRTIDDVQMYCFSQNQHKHRFHSENTHLNTISDLCYSLLYNFDSERSSQYYINNKFAALYQKQKQKTEQLLEKLEFLKNSQSIDFISNLPTRKEIEKFLQPICEQHNITKQLFSEVQKLQKQVKDLEAIVEELKQHILRIIG